jgi:hypothetical protein
MKHKTKTKTLRRNQRVSLRNSIFSLRAKAVVEVKWKGQNIPFYFCVKNNELITFDNTKVIQVEYYS